MNEIMTFHISIDQSKLTKFKGLNGEVNIIPFEGYVDSELFKGKILPGAVDVQETNLAGVRHMQAKYVFYGKDSLDNDCYLYVENNGYFMEGTLPSPFKAIPRFITDSEILLQDLKTGNIISKGYSTENGVDIKIYRI